MTHNTVYVLAPDEDWIVDRFVQDWYNDVTNAFFSVKDPMEADVIWLMADWCASKLPRELLQRKKVITTVHHIVPEKFTWFERNEFVFRDNITTVYHVPNQRTYDFIRPLTTKPIHLIPYWANQEIWKITEPNKANAIPPILATKQVLSYEDK